MKKICITVLSLCVLGMQAQSFKDKLKAAEDKAKTEEQALTGSGSKDLKVPTSEEIVQGLKEALNSGTNKSTGSASQVDGYLKNPRLFIPFPPEAQKMRNTLVEMGMEQKVNEFETSLNRAAEKAAESAAVVFLESIKNMTVSDGMSILKGADTAATYYLKQTTSAELYTKYKPIVKDAIDKVKVTEQWNPLVTKYNRIPMVKKQNPDLEDYVTKRAMAGLFLLVSDEEAKIRKDPAARATDILKKVFGFADSQKK